MKSTEVSKSYVYMKVGAIWFWLCKEKQWKTEKIIYHKKYGISHKSDDKWPNNNLTVQHIPAQPNKTQLNSHKQKRERHIQSEA